MPPTTSARGKNAERLFLFFLVLLGALSMLALNAMVSCWIEKTRQCVPGAVPRSYADDISATVAAKSAARLKDQLRKVHDVTQAYEKTTGVEISIKKSYTFGHRCIQGALAGMKDHLDSCRLGEDLSLPTTTC